MEGISVGKRSRRHWLRSAVALGALARSGRAADSLFRAIELNHIALAVTDPARSSQYYRRLVGVRVLEQNSGSCILGLQKNYVTLVKSDQPGMISFSIAVANFESGAAASTLKSAGYKLAEKDRGAWTLPDPDGIQVRLSAPDERQAEVSRAYAADRNPDSVFQAIDINHVATRVADLDRSRDFYQKLFGLAVMSQDSGSCFLDVGGDFLTLFRGDPGRMDHFCLAVEEYDVQTAVKKLTENGHKPHRTADRVYFPDPDGLTVQLAARGHGP